MLQPPYSALIYRALATHEEASHPIQYQSLPANSRSTFVSIIYLNFSFSHMLSRYRSEHGGLSSSPIFDKNGVLFALRTGHPAGWLSRFNEFESSIDELQRRLPIWSSDWEVSRTCRPSPHFGYSFGGGQTVGLADS